MGDLFLEAKKLAGPNFSQRVYPAIEEKTGQPAKKSNLSLREFFPKIV